MQEFEKLTAALASGRPGALATLVRIDGSSYRAPGARMWLEGGAVIGAISGGCLEADLAERARVVIADGKPQLATYDTRTDEDLMWGTGMGCGGLAQVLIEPWPAPGPSLPALWRECAALGRAGMAATLFPAGDKAPAWPIQRLLLREDGAVEENVADAALRQTLIAEARRLSAETRTREWMLARSRALRYQTQTGDVWALWEPVLPPQPLIVLGGGYDAAPVVETAANLGWRVFVVDHRPHFARRRHFPRAHAVIHAEGRNYWDQVPRHARAAAVVMSHHYGRDKAYLAALLQSEVRYIGALGPWRRTERILDELGALPLDDRDRDRLHAPVGLDLDAETPEEVALSIVAEIRAFLAGRAGGSLKLRDGPIHSRRLDNP